jgi:ATP synthase protein I
MTFTDPKDSEPGAENDKRNAGKSSTDESRAEEASAGERVIAGRITQAAQQAMLRQRRGLEQPEPSLGSRLGQMGILGWTIVLPTLLGLVLGHSLDRHFASGVFFSAPLLMIGAAVGLWSAWKWMHHQSRSQGS